MLSSFTLMYKNHWIHFQALGVKKLIINNLNSEFFFLHYQWTFNKKFVYFLLFSRTVVRGNHFAMQNEQELCYVSSAPATVFSSVSSHKQAGCGMFLYSFHNLGHLLNNFCKYIPITFQHLIFECTKFNVWAIEETCFFIYMSLSSKSYV